jgi:hypothetical protein
MLEGNSAGEMEVKSKDAGPPSATEEDTTEKLRRPIRLGLLKGKGWIADDFDAPLPDEIQAQFEGRDPKRS